MAFLKAQEVRTMAPEDRASRLHELRQELIHERGIAAMGGSPPSPGKIRQIRRQIARMLTIQNEERHGIRGQKPPAPTRPPAAATPASAARAPAQSRKRPSRAKKPAPQKAPAPKKTKPKEATRRNG